MTTRVIESTGRFRTRTDAARHIQAGARKVIMSAPMKAPEPADAGSTRRSASDLVELAERVLIPVPAAA